MQELCKAKLGWDHPLEGEALSKWIKLANSLNPSPLMALPRCYSGLSPDGEITYCLHGFCDTFGTAYAAVVYLVIETNGHKYHMFIMYKAWVAHHKALMLPRMELHVFSSVLLAWLIFSITESLSLRMPLNKPRSFTDPQMTFYRITGTERKWKSFVQHEVNKICKLVPVGGWSH